MAQEVSSHDQYVKVRNKAFFLPDRIERIEVGLFLAPTCLRDSSKSGGSIK